MPTQAPAIAPPRRPLPRQIWASLAAWAGLYLYGQTLSAPYTLIDVIFLLAALVVAPLLLHIIEAPASIKEAHGIAALCAVASAWLPTGPSAGFFAAIWLGFTLLLAVFGIFRFGSRHPRANLPELCIDLGLFYASIGGAWWLAARMGWMPLGFGEPIVSLTAVHFHFAGLAAPVFAGLIGRALSGRAPRVYRISTWAVLAGPALVALGIAGTRAVELVSVAVLAGALLTHSALTLRYIVPSARPQPVQIALAVAAGGMLITMFLAFLYALGSFLGRQFILIPAMVRYHGQFNALGYALLGGLSWWAIRPPPYTPAQSTDVDWLLANRALPLSHARPAPPGNWWIDTYERSLGPDPSGERFAAARELALRYRFYPPEVMTPTGEFDLEDRIMRVGDRVAQRLQLLKILDLPGITGRTMVAIDEVIDAPAAVGFTYVTTTQHVGIGHWTLRIERRGDGGLWMLIDSLARPAHPPMRLIGPIFRHYQHRAHQLGMAEFERRITPAPPA